MSTIDVLYSLVIMRYDKFTCTQKLAFIGSSTIYHMQRKKPGKVAKKLKTTVELASRCMRYHVKAVKMVLSLPPDLRSPLNSRRQFPSKLKTHLFRQAYNTA